LEQGGAFALISIGLLWLLPLCLSLLVEERWENHIRPPTTAHIKGQAANESSTGIAAAIAGLFVVVKAT
jgi:hypothetical protein